MSFAVNRSSGATQPLLGSESVQVEGHGKLSDSDGQINAIAKSRFKGGNVGIQQLSLSDQVDQLRQESRNRLGEPRGLGSKVLNVIGTILTTVVALPVKIA